MSRSRIVFATLALALGCGLPHAGARAEAAAPDPFAASPPPDNTLAEMGAPRFQRFCASCHGVDARGDGPVGRALQIPPPDLRRIAARRGGHFPSGEVARKIDGRFELASHGSRDMPVWGQSFGSDRPGAGQREATLRGEIAVLVAYLHSIQEGPDTPADPEEIRATMAEILAAMQLLLPLSLSDEGFERPDEADRIRGALLLLDQSSARLSQHGASRDAAFTHLARSLAIDARDIRRRYDAGHRNEARYLVHTLTETCVACHSRLPGTSAPRSEAFTSNIEVSSLPLAKRAKLAYATRQFEKALELYEAVLADPALPANEIDLGGHLDDYLELSIRVERNPARAAAALTAFAKRSDLSPALRTDLRHWITALESLAAAGKQPASLERAEGLAGPFEPIMQSDRQRLVEHLAASSLVHQTLDSDLSDQERAEAYYALGWIQTRIGRSYWLSQAEAYLESAIRLAPGSPTAQRAYTLLNQFVTAGFTGSSGTHIPADLSAKLETLGQIANTPVL